jgi:hypothetical protein
MKYIAASLIALVVIAGATCLTSADDSDIPTTPTATTPGCPASGWPPPSLVQCFYKSAAAFRNHSTKWRGTQCPGQSNLYWGNCACAAAASVVILNATLTSLGFINVDEFEAAAKRGTYGGGFVPDARAQPGDVVLWYSADRAEAHIGFCATDKCVKTWSNSSSRGMFAPIEHSISLDGYYPIHEIWEPVHLP